MAVGPHMWVRFGSSSPPTNTRFREGFFKISRPTSRSCVTTVTRRASRARATSRHVDPESMNTDWPSRMRSAMAGPIARFSARFGESCRNSSVSSSWGIGIAPPWVRRTRPASARCSRSLRMVDTLTSRASANEDTVSKPVASIMETMVSCRVTMVPSAGYGLRGVRRGVQMMPAIVHRDRRPLDTVPNFRRECARYRATRAFA